MKKTILATLSLAFFAFPAYASFLSRIFANRATMKATRLVALCACVFTLAASMSANATVMFVGNTAGIFTVETSTGATTPLASSINVADALTFGPNGLLFAGNTAGIFTVDVSTGATTRIAPSLNVAQSLTFGPDGLLYAGVGSAGIFSIDVSTGATNRLASPINVAQSLAFDPDGLLYAGVGSVGIFTVDVSTGATNRLGSQINVANALAFAPTVPEPTPVPEPPTLALFTVGLAGFGFVGWRRRKGPNQSLAQKPLRLLTAQ